MGECLPSAESIEPMVDALPCRAWKGLDAAASSGDAPPAWTGLPGRSRRWKAFLKFDFQLAPYDMTTCRENPSSAGFQAGLSAVLSPPAPGAAAAWAPCITCWENECPEVGRYASTSALLGMSRYFA